MKNSKFAMAALVLTLFSNSSLAGEAYRFGVLNQAPAAETAALWNPILAYLEKKTGHSFRFAMGPTVQDTDAATGRGEYALSLAITSSTRHIARPITTPLRNSVAIHLLARSW